MGTIPHAPGIYQWLCAPTGKIYVGSTVDLYKRRKEHRNNLRAGRHVASHLQYAWNKYGEAAFEFSILELVMFAEDLPAREQAWLDTTRCYDRTIGFNTCRVANVTTGIKMSAESRAKMSKASLGKPKTAAHVQNVADGLARDWIVITPDGQELQVKNLAAFCREHGLNDGKMIRIANGEKKNKTYYGYRCVRLSPKRKQRNAKF
jgi:group I intron endonuclease